MTNAAEEEAASSFASPGIGPSTLPLAPLAYARQPSRDDSLFGIVGVVVGLFCAVVPGSMVWALLFKHRRQWSVYTPYTNQAYGLSYHANWPWYALDCLAVLLGLIGLYRGRARFAVAALAVAGVSLVATLTIVLGSPW